MAALRQPASPFLQPKVSRRRIAAFACSTVLLALILWRIHPERLGEVLENIRPLPALAALACVVGAAALLAVRWRWMLQLQGVDDGYPAAWAGVLVGNALSAALLGALLADIAKSGWYSRRHGHAYSAVLLACGLDRVCGGFGLVLYGLTTAALALVGGMHWPGSWTWNLPTNGRVLALGAITVLLLTAGGLVARQKPQLLASLHSARDQIGQAWTLLRQRPQRLTAAIALSFAANLLLGATLGFALASVGKPTGPWLAVVWTFPVIGLVASFPLTFAGAGAREGAAMAIWSGFGISPPVAVAACLVTLGATLLGTVPGTLLIATGCRSNPSGTPPDRDECPPETEPGSRR